MEELKPQFVGPPCGQYGAHQFYRRFRYSTKDGRTRDINLGEFFFVRMSAEEDPCIGELQLLCTSRNNEQQLSALRLYFLPEQTPEGRLSHHGEHEVLVASDRVVLKLEDLASWVTDQVEWNHGIVAPKVQKHDEVEKSQENAPLNDTNNNTTTAPTSEPPPSQNNDTPQEEVVVPGEDVKKDVKEEVQDSEEDTKETQVVVLSYQSYCRYRTILQRISGGDKSEWLQNSLVQALGGFTPTTHKTHVLFCRDNFEHDELAHHELNCEYLAPTIKGKRRKRKTKNTRSISPESVTSEESKVIEAKKNQKPNGPKQPPVKNEQEFLQRLFKFMKKRNTPIQRVPNLGFKQIDLYIFYSFAQKLGGYDKITGKRLWKHVYDELGGNPGSTSAATCTRRHYERLLLPFERFMDGITYKPAQRGKKSQKKKQQQEDQLDAKENPASDLNTPTKAESNANLKAEADEVYAFTDSNHENSNSKDSNSNEFNIVCDEDDQGNTNEQVFSDEDSKTVWSIQKPPDSKDETSQDKDEGKPIKPLIIQKGQGETFAEKERKWDEIRRKNAAARKWVRQSRSTSRGCKTPVPEIPPFKQEKLEIPLLKQEKEDPEPANMEGRASLPPVPVKTEIKMEISDDTATLTKSPVSSPNKVVGEARIPTTPPKNNDSPNKFLSPDLGKVKSENHHTPKRRHILAKETPSHLTADKKYVTVAKTETRKHSNSWCGYPANHSEHSSQPSSLYSGADRYSPGNGHYPASYKDGTRSEPDIAREYPMHTGRHSVGSLSASSVVSAEVAPGDDKPLLPQRRPSVIQHTEFAAPSPSPSPPPKPQEIGCDATPIEVKAFSSPKVNLLPSQMSYSMNGKVAEWLTKGVQEAVACKTPSATVEKNMELHDKVMMPSSCKTPGAVGTGKVPANSSRSKQASKSRSKYSRQRNCESGMNGNYSNTSSRNDRAHSQKMLHPIPTTYSVMSNPVCPPKYQQTMNVRMKAEFYPNTPYYNQPKRHKVNHMLPAMLPPVSSRPPLSPFARGTTYCTQPLSDIPKIAAITHNDYESAVLDLSVKRKPVAPPPKPAPPPRPPSPVPEGVCLDLSVKKKCESLLTTATTDNGIENITPPLSNSPTPTYLQSQLAAKQLTPLTGFQDLSAAEEIARRGYSSGRIPTSTVTAPVACPPIAMHPPMFSPAHTKLHPGLPPMAYSSKDIAKNLYMPGGNSSTRHAAHYPSYVIPPFFPSNWTSVVSPPAGPAKPVGNSHHPTSPMTYKGMVNHSVFPKDYPYNMKPQFHPALCKDNGHYPSNDNK